MDNDATSFPQAFQNDALLCECLQDNSNEGFHTDGQRILIDGELGMVMRVDNALFDVAGSNVEERAWRDALVCREVLAAHVWFSFNHDVFPKDVDQYLADLFSHCLVVDNRAIALFVAELVCSSVRLGDSLYNLLHEARHFRSKFRLERTHRPV